MSALDARRRCAAWEWSEADDALVHCSTLVTWPLDAPEPVLCVLHWDRIAGSDHPMPGPDETPVIFGGR